MNGKALVMTNCIKKRLTHASKADATGLDFSHIAPVSKRFQENAEKRYVIGPRYSHAQIMAMLMNSFNEEENKDENQTNDNKGN